jgi:hypothetical protein
MGTHLIPRSDVKGQDRFFIFFSIQGLIGTVIAALPGVVLFKIFDSMGLTLVGFAFIALFGSIGFVIGQCKIPEMGAFPALKQVGGLYVKDVILMYWKFKKNKKKYVLQTSKDQEFAVKEETKLEKIVLNKE